MESLNSLAATVEPALLDATRAAFHARPADPVAFIADFLARRASETRAPAALEPASTQPAATPSPREGAWAAAAWISTLDGVTKAIAASLLGAQPPDDELAVVRALCATVRSAAALEERLKSAGAVTALANALYPAMKELASAQVATGAELHDKFSQEGALRSPCCGVRARSRGAWHTARVARARPVW